MLVAPIVVSQIKDLLKPYSHTELARELKALLVPAVHSLLTNWTPESKIVGLWRDEQLKIVRICEHSFVEDWISRRSLVVDLGLNQGAFASAVAERYGCRIIGAEPDPTLFQALPDIKGLEKESIAIGSDGVVKLHLNITCCSSTIFKENEKEAQNIALVPSMTLQRFLEIKAVDLVHLLKVDIEGAEVAMFDAAADGLLRQFEQITVEFHEFMDHSLSPDVCRIRRRLRRLGFYDIDFTRTRMDVLFINQKFHPLSMWQRVRLRLESYIRGVMRVVGRFLLQKSSHKAANFVGRLLLQAATSRDPSLKKISSPQASGDME